MNQHHLGRIDVLRAIPILMVFFHHYWIEVSGASAVSYLVVQSGPVALDKSILLVGLDCHAAAVACTNSWI
jgi:peptidoglycan/LPS O-acetylase OafA/YrhL